MELNTPRLYLRDFLEDDWPAVLAYQNDPRYLRYYPWESRSEDEVRGFVGMFLAHQSQQPRQKFQLAIIHKQDGRLIGNCGIRRSDSKEWEADLGYELDPRAWGLGYASEAARAMLDFGFAHLRLHRVWATCIAENRASAHVLEKLGMRLEGRLRHHEFFKGRYWDTLLYAILEGDHRVP